MQTIENVISRVSNDLYPVAHNQLRNVITTALFSQLKTVDFEDELELAIMEDKMVEKYRDAIMPTHEPVGVLTSTTINENITQSALSSHRAAGVETGAVGFQRVEEISNMSSKSGLVKVITKPVAGVPRSKKEVVELANQIVSVDVNDICVLEGDRYTIEKIEEDGEILDLLPKWYRLFCLMNNISDKSLSKMWLRIHISKDAMYKHKISIFNIASSIQDSLNDFGTVIYPPSVVGSFIDIHVRNNTDENNLYSLLGNINSSIVGGISSVQRSYAISENMLANLSINQVDENIFVLESRVSKFIPDIAWDSMIRSFIPDAIIISSKKFQSNYTLTEIKKMILECPLIYADIIKSRKNDGDVVLIEFDTDKINEFPYLEYANLEPREFVSDEEADKFILQIMVENHLYWYIEALCWKIETLYVMPEIDTTRTHTTSPMDCRDSLGYLAMRQMLYQDFLANISSIDPIHVKLVIDNMTVYREPVSFKRQAIRNDKSEPLTYCTFEEVLKYLAAAAFAGEEDHMNSISSHILTGSMIDIGRGGKHMKKKSNNNLSGNKFIELKNESIEDKNRSKQRDPKSVKSKSTKSSAPKTKSIPSKNTSKSATNKPTTKSSKNNKPETTIK